MPTVGGHTDRPAPGVLEGGAGGGDTALAHLFGGVVEVPFGFRTVIGFEQLELSFHATSIPRGCDSERSKLRTTDGGYLGAAGATRGQGRSCSMIRARSSSSASSW